MKGLPERPQLAKTYATVPPLNCNVENFFYFHPNGMLVTHIRDQSWEWRAETSLKYLDFPRTSTLTDVFIINADVGRSSGLCAGHTCPSGERKCFQCVLSFHMFSILSSKPPHTCDLAAANFTNLLPWKHWGRLSAS